MTDNQKVEMIKLFHAYGVSLEISLFWLLLILNVPRLFLLDMLSFVSLGYIATVCAFLLKSWYHYTCNTVKSCKMCADLCDVQKNVIIIVILKEFD